MKFKFCLRMKKITFWEFIKEQKTYEPYNLNTRISYYFPAVFIVVSEQTFYTKLVNISFWSFLLISQNILEIKIEYQEKSSTFRTLSHTNLKRRDHLKKQTNIERSGRSSSLLIFLSKIFFDQFYSISHFYLFIFRIFE